MARLHNLSRIVLLALLLVRLAVSADPPETTPSPAPELGGDSLSPPPDVGSPESPSPLPELSSPPAPLPSDLAHGSSPAPAPAPSEVSDVSPDMSGINAEEKESSGRLKGGQKAGIMLGLIAGLCLVGLGGVLYRKRQQNIRRSQYGYAARNEFL